MTTDKERAAHIAVNSWAGRTRVAVVVIGETRTKYRCRLVSDAKLPGRDNWQKAGHVFLAPKTAVTFSE